MIAGNENSDCDMVKGEEQTNQQIMQRQPYKEGYILKILKIIEDEDGKISQKRA